MNNQVVKYFILLTLFFGCLTGEKFTDQAVTFDCPTGWKIVKDVEIGVKFENTKGIGCALPNQDESSYLGVFAISYKDLPKTEQDRLDKDELLKNTFDESIADFGEFNDGGGYLTISQSTYAGYETNLATAHIPIHGILTKVDLHNFNCNDHLINIFKLSLEEHAEKTLSGFKTIEESFTCK